MTDGRAIVSAVAAAPAVPFVDAIEAYALPLDGNGYVARRKWALSPGVLGWFGWLAPVGMPPAIGQRLNMDLVAAPGSPEGRGNVSSPGACFPDGNSGELPSPLARAQCACRSPR